MLTTSGVTQWKFKYLAVRSFDGLRTGSEPVEGQRQIFHNLSGQTPREIFLSFKEFKERVHF
jgi:hypothetical protein